MKDFIVRQGDEMLDFLIKKFNMVNIYLKELEEYGSTSNDDMGNMDDVDSIVQSLYDEDVLYRKHYDYDTLYNLVWKAMDKAAKIANKKYNNKENIMKINESQLKKIIKESIKQVLMEGGHLYAKDTDGNVYTTSKETWRGVPNTTFVSHGEWSDPEIIYQGYSLNYYDVEELLEYNYQEDVKSGYQGSFEDWVNERDVTELESILDSIICEC